ncbi:DUF362 domain-containing protein [bacterium]|nr:DUF362 domain-containing protein [bacterium]
MATVIFKRETDYDVGKIYDSLVEMIEIGGLSDKIKYGERILLKPNLLAARTPDSAVTTHPAVVEAVAKIVLDYSAIPIIGDSPGGAIRGTQRVLKNTGMLKISEKLGIETISLEAKSAIQIKLPDGKILHISKIINEVDGIINIAKLKTHSLVLMTLTVKNLYGLIPGFRKAEYHKIYPTPPKFARLVAELYSAVKDNLKFSVLDGIVGMDGNGPSSGQAHKFGLLALSDNPPALDFEIENIAGLKSHSPIMKELIKRNLVPQYEVKWLGEKIENFKNFKIPSNWYLYLAPAFLTKFLGKLVQVAPDVVDSKCIHCGDCMHSCPVDAITMIIEKTSPKFDYSKCIRCLCCHEICPTKAIIFKKSILAKFIK